MARPVCEAIAVVEWLCHVTRRSAELASRGIQGAKAPGLGCRDVRLHPCRLPRRQFSNIISLQEPIQKNTSLPRPHATATYLYKKKNSYPTGLSSPPVCYFLPSSRFRDHSGKKCPDKKFHGFYFSPLFLPLFSGWSLLPYLSPGNGYN